jgi:hypothetical protein
VAGRIAALFGGKSRPPDTNPAPGIGGYAAGPGPAGETGFPGSTRQTRTLRGNNPRIAKVRADTNTGFEQALGTTTVTQQHAYRGDMRGAALNGPRTTGRVVTPQTRIQQGMQHNAEGEFYGGPMLRTGPGNNTAGGTPMTPAQHAGGHSQRDTTTPWIQAQPVIGADTPGANNVRNEVAQRYKCKPGQTHTYRSAARADQAPVNRGGQTTDGNVHPERVSSDVTVPNRFVYPGGGNTTWSITRTMPYTGPGNGARGAHLSGQRYYTTGQDQQFWNAGQGNYGIERQRGSGRKRPVSFTEPAPWTSNFYDTTSEVGTSDNPGTPTQAPSAVYVSPGTGRAKNSTGRM